MTNHSKKRQAGSASTQKRKNVHVQIKMNHPHADLLVFDQTHLKKATSMHKILLSRTESAVLQIAEYAHSSKDSLTLSKLKYLLRDHGPVAINQRVRTSGTFLVEVCQARHIAEGVILKCIKLLVEEYGANPNILNAEFSSVRNLTIQAPSGNAASKTACLTSTIGNELYPLIIAAARGMPTVVKYLLRVGADKSRRGSSRFCTFSNPKKSVKGENLTALEFAVKMQDEEHLNGLANRDKKYLNRAIQYLSEG